MYYPQTPFPVPLRLPIHSFQAGDTEMTNSSSSAAAEELRHPCTQSPESPGRWGSLNTLVNIATQFADSDPKN